MTCDEAKEVAGDAIDQMLSTAASAEFHRHLTLCPPCQRAFELELATRNTIRRSLPRRPTPPLIRHEVLMAVEAEERSFKQSGRLLIRLRGREASVPLTVGVIVALTALLAAAVGVQRMRAHAAVGTVNIVRVAVEDLEKIRSGSLRPSIVATEAEEIDR